MAEVLDALQLFPIESFVLLQFSQLDEVMLVFIYRKKLCFFEMTSPTSSNPSSPFTSSPLFYRSPTDAFLPYQNRWLQPFRRISCKLEAAAVPTVRTLNIAYPELKDRSVDLSWRIKEGFGPKGLGVISISDVPGYPMLRQTLLHLSRRVAHLPEDVKREMEDPESRYNFGWSHGKERLESGKHDSMKGSFYANPVLDKPTTDTCAIQRYPAYCRANKWPTSALPELEGAFKALGQLMLNVGLLVAYHCDAYVLTEIMAVEYYRLEDILKRSRCHKGRLLHYFPRWESEGKEDSSSVSSWCGWHMDHGSLTALTSGIFMKNDVEIACPDDHAGLYVETRNHQVVKVVFGVDELAYQIGETTEILSRGLLCATPHCVQAPKGEESLGVERSTFALFMQPDWDEELQFPSKVDHHKELIPSNVKLTFGEFSELLLRKYY